MASISTDYRVEATQGPDAVAGTALRARSGALRDRQALTNLRGAALGRPNRHGNHLGLLVINLDGLDAKCPVPGLPMGEMTLVVAASVLRKCTRREDLFARLPTGELGLAAYVWEPADELKVAERIKAAFHLASRALGGACTMSIGIVAGGETPLDEAGPRGAPV